MNTASMSSSANATASATATPAASAPSTALSTAAKAHPSAPVHVPSLHGPGPDEAWRELLRAAREPYRQSGRVAWHFARGKLSRDPVFRGLLERGAIPPRARVLDIGCGQGLLASLLAAVDAAQAHGRWPGAWQAAPVAVRYTGIELMPREVARAEGALAGLARPPQFVCADMCEAAFPASDVVVILDVLHYVDLAAQQALLGRVRDALLPHGRLLLRVADSADWRGSAASQWVDRIVTLLRRHRLAPMFCRSLAEWVALLERLGFVVHSVPMSRGTPFANLLLAADLR